MSIDQKGQLGSSEIKSQRVHTRHWKPCSARIEHEGSVRERRRVSDADRCVEDVAMSSRRKSVDEVSDSLQSSNQAERRVGREGRRRGRV
jgi:hypothetical protein